MGDSEWKVRLHRRVFRVSEENKKKPPMPKKKTIDDPDLDKVVDDIGKDVAPHPYQLNLPFVDDIT